jgi:hypothetical protein
LTEAALHSVATCIENAAEHKKMQEAFCENGGAFEALLQLSEHMEFKPCRCRWISSIFENRIGGFSPMGDTQRISMSKGCHSGGEPISG